MQPDGGTVTGAVWSEVSCKCGNFKVLAPPEMNFANLRCWMCPKDEERPALRLVKE